MVDATYDVDLSPYAMIDHLHRYRLYIEEQVDVCLLPDISSIVVNYACDRIQFIFELQRNLLNEREGSVEIIRASLYQPFTIKLTCPDDYVYIVGSGIDAWDLIIFELFPNHSVFRNFKKSTINVWLDDISKIKSRLYDLS